MEGTVINAVLYGVLAQETDIHHWKTRFMMRKPLEGGNMSQTEVPVEDQEPKMGYTERVLVELFTLLPQVDVALIRHYAVVCMVKGENTTLEDVANARQVWDYYAPPESVDLAPHQEAIKEVARKLSS